MALFDRHAGSTSPPIGQQRPPQRPPGPVLPLPGDGTGNLGVQAKALGSTAPTWPGWPGRRI
ncbi:MAG TPA: hypothetical protein VK816_00035 [Jatrophihabitantaceae bacterium]|nr:hypothetical protein [Jatrophihabitantaceae bacterium]